MLTLRHLSMSLRRSARVASVGAVQDVADTTGHSQKRAAAETSSPPASKKVKSAKKSQPVTTTSDDAMFKKPTAPATPLRKRRAANNPTKAPPPLTPTPSLVNIIRAPYSSGDIDDATPPPEDRPVGPHVTNATLVTPGGTQHVVYGNGLPESSPSKTGVPRPTGTTGTVLEQACAHLISVDARMKPLVEKHTCHIFSPAGLAEEIDPFRSLASGIMGQQVSGAAAKSIKNKFIALFNEDQPEKTPLFPTPAQVAKTPIPRLRLAGLSERKAEYIQGLAQKFADGELTTQMLMKATDEEVMEKLIAVRGLGKWSVEMFACFGLKRLDILSTGDLGVQRGMAAFFGKDVKKLKAKGGGKWKYMSEQDMLDKSAPFAPYRSLYMWLVSPHAPDRVPCRLLLTYPGICGAQRMWTWMLWSSEGRLSLLPGVRLINLATDIMFLFAYVQHLRRPLSGGRTPALQCLSC
jgi:DNA-3-methyladenine glycosylase II